MSVPDPTPKLGIIGQSFERDRELIQRAAVVALAEVVSCTHGDMGLRQCWGESQRHFSFFALVCHAGFRGVVTEPVHHPMYLGEGRVGEREARVECEGPLVELLGS